MIGDCGCLSTHRCSAASHCLMYLIRRVLGATTTGAMMSNRVVSESFGVCLEILTVGGGGGG